ncbi:MAG: hypothetical protein AABY87_04120 [bacterium]
MLPLEGVSLASRRKYEILNPFKQGKSNLESSLASMKNENRQLSEFLSLLPDAVERINASEKRESP